MQRAGVRRIPPAARLLPDRVFYGWYVAVACSVLMFVSVGVGYYGLAVFLRPLQEVHDWSNSAVSGATGLYFSVAGLTGVLIGPRIDRRGPIMLMLVGSVGIGTSVALIGYVDAVWQLYAVYCALAVSFGLSTSVATGAVMTRWFVTRRARAMSVSATGISVGGVVLAPLGSWLIDAGGLELATPSMGLLVIVVSVPVILLVLAWDPADMGLAPDGVVEDLSRRADGSGARRPLTHQHRQWTRTQVVRTRAFWTLLVAFLLVLTAQTGFVIHQISFLETRFGSRSAAAFALSVTALGSIVARLVVGSFADAVDKRVLTAAIFVVQATAVVAVVGIESRPLTYAVILVFGFTIGNVYMMQSLLVGEIFGLASFATVFGLVSLASQIGSGVGPFAVGWLDDTTGGYTAPFLVTAGVTYLAAVIVMFTGEEERDVGASAGVSETVS